MSKGKKLETFNTAYASYKKNSKEPLDKKTWLNLLNGFAEYLMNCLTKGETIYLEQLC